jgi:hypothetical protein
MCADFNSICFPQLQLSSANEALTQARDGWSAEVTALKTELSAALVCKANADTLIELLQQQLSVHSHVDAAPCSDADDTHPAFPHVDRASRRLSSEHEDLRSVSARVVTLQWELGRSNAERQGCVHFPHASLCFCM